MKKGISTLPDTSSTNPSTSQITNNSHNDEKQSNKEKADRRYKIMMSTLKEASIKEEKERVKSAEQKNEFLKQLETKYENNSKNEQNKTNSKLTKNTVRAPNELLQEFLVYVMEKNWKDALKLCGFILIYEPNNATAKEYLPLLEKRVAQIESQGESDSSDSISSNDDESGESESTTDDSDQDSSSTDDSDDQEANKLEKIFQKDKDKNIEIPSSKPNFTKDIFKLK